MYTNPDKAPHGSTGTFITINTCSGLYNPDKAPRGIDNFTT
jgi:hypothetical protein